MSEKQFKVPGPDHPITVEPSRERVIVRAGGRVIADTRASLILREAAYPPVRYVPRGDVDMAALSHSTNRTHCPYKGDASYFSIPAGGDRAVDAVWTYEAPHDAVALIACHLAFYPDRMDSIEVVG